MVKLQKLFIAATGPKKKLDEVAEKCIGQKVFPAVFMPSLSGDLRHTVSHFPSGVIVSAKRVEGGILMYAEPYDDELEGLQ